jgi:hypothetical protein
MNPPGRNSKFETDRVGAGPLLTTIFALLVVCVAAQAEDSAVIESDAKAVGPAEPPPNEANAEKRREAVAGVLALCGILVLSAGSVLAVLIWGGRLRRMARADLPAQKTLKDDLWFLKPPRTPPDEP